MDTETAVEIFAALVSAIARSGLRHRLIVTCRYDFNLPDVALNARLFRVPLFSLRGVDLKKKCDRLAGFKLPLSREDAEPLVALQKQAIAVADGNPRLLEWLAAILPNDLLTEAQKQEVLDRMNAKQTEFREHILAETLLAQQSPDLREMLKLGLVFDLPVPELVFAKVCEGVENLKVHQDRAKAIGLLEVNGDLYRVPKILVELLSPEFTQEIYATAARELYRVWGESDYKINKNEALEIHRLAVLGKEKKIVVEIGFSLAENLRINSRFREVIHICKDILAISRSSKILNQLAFCEQVLGNVDRAEEYYQQAINEISSEDDLTKSFTLHCLGTLKAQQGKLGLAMKHYNQSLEIKDRIGGNLQGKSATLYQKGLIFAQQGQIGEAMKHYQHSLEIADRIGDLDLNTKLPILGAIADIHLSQGLVKESFDLYQQILEISRQIGAGAEQFEATALHQIAIICVHQGNLDIAIEFYEKSLKINNQIENAEAKAANLHQIAGVYAKQEKSDLAIDFYQQSLVIREKMKDLNGKAHIFANIGSLLAKKGDLLTSIRYLQKSFTILKNLKSPKASSVKELLDQIRKLYKSQ
jgi:tetratricopeptide (TPR) repeat protein